jgi:hypothetical protein
MDRMSSAAAEVRQLALNDARAAVEAKIRRARTNLGAFIEVCGKDENGDAVDLDYIHRSWIVHVNYAWSHGKNAMIMAPFNSGKTSTMGIPICGYLIGQNPQIRIKIVCANDDMAKLRVASVKALIDSYAYKKVFPGIKRGQKWDTQDAFVERQGFSTDPTIQARGVLTEGIGSKCDIMLMDDVCTQKNSEQEAVRKRIKEMATGTWMSRLDGDEARALAFATAWSSDDYSNDLLNDRRWCTLVQRVQMPDLDHYEQEVHGQDLDDYPVGSAA